MAKTKAKPTKVVPSALEAHAQASVSKQTRQHGEYSYETFTDRPDGKGMEENGRMRRVSPVRALEGLFVHHPKASEPYLNAIHNISAWDYHGLLNSAKGGMSHELREAVDSSGNPEMRTLNHIEAVDKLSRLHLRMPMDFRSMLDLIYISRPDSSMHDIWPNRQLRNMSRTIIRDTLDWLAVEFGHKSR